MNTFAANPGTPNHGLEQAKQRLRSMVEGMKMQFHVNLLTANGGRPPADLARKFREYAGSLERMLSAMFAKLDAAQAIDDALTATRQAVAAAVAIGDLDEARRLYYRWSERNFGATGMVQGIRYV